MVAVGESDLEQPKLGSGGLPESPTKEAKEAARRQSIEEFIEMGLSTGNFVSETTNIPNTTNFANFLDCFLKNL